MDVLYEWSHSEHDEALRREVGEMERRLSELLNECDTKIQHLSDLDVKWTEFSRDAIQSTHFRVGARFKFRDNFE